MNLITKIIIIFIINLINLNVIFCMTSGCSKTKMSETIDLSYELSIEYLESLFVYICVKIEKLIAKHKDEPNLSKKKDLSRKLKKMNAYRLLICEKIQQQINDEGAQIENINTDVFRPYPEARRTKWCNLI